jgi:hypothetical protein
MVFGALGFLMSVFTLLYTRGQTKSAFAQVDILKKEA